jgi:NTE family protein
MAEGAVQDHTNRGGRPAAAPDGRPAPEEVTPTQPVGVVLAGAGARGAYEAGMLSALLPALDDRGLRPQIYVGTSAGAINAALFASLAHLPAGAAAQKAVDTWLSIDKPKVMRPAWTTLPLVGARYVAGLLGLPGQLNALLDTRPLLASLEDASLLDWNQLHANLRPDAAGRVAVQTLAVVTTECGSGRTKVFYETGVGQSTVASDETRGIDYVSAALSGRHVAASAAIPVAFPPVQLGQGSATSWHMDGGVRLNTPLKPAIALGAESLVVIATDPNQYGSAGSYPSRTGQSLFDSIGQVMHGLMDDRMVEDLATLNQTNRLVEGGGNRVKDSSGDRTYIEIPFLFGGPQVPARLTAVSDAAHAQALQGLRWVSRPDLALISLLLSGSPDSRGDLMTYLFFEPEFIERALRLGQADGAAALAAGWCV